MLEESRYKVDSLLKYAALGSNENRVKNVPDAFMDDEAEEFIGNFIATPFYVALEEIKCFLKYSEREDNL